MPSAKPSLPDATQAATPEIAPSAADYRASAWSASTRRAYRSGLANFRNWAQSEGRPWLPSDPPTVAGYLAHLANAGRSPSTINQRLAAIRWAHEAEGQPSPTTHALCRTTMSGIRRSKGTRPERKDAATSERVRDMARACSDDLLGLRDRALLLFGFASALRRSELVALTVEGTELTARGMLVTISESKTDQERQGRQIAILPGRNPETCPLRALLLWLHAAGITEGRLLRRVDRHGNVGESLSDRAVGEIVKRLAKRAGLDPARFGGHSLRAGFITSAVERGARVDRVMDHSGHKTAQMIRTYTWRTDAFEDHAGDGLL